MSKVRELVQLFLECTSPLDALVERPVRPGSTENLIDVNYPPHPKMYSAKEVTLIEVETAVQSEARQPVPQSEANERGLREGEDSIPVRPGTIAQGCNPTCGNPLHYLRSGRVIRVTRRENDRVFVEHRWLCQDCCNEYDLVPDASGNVVIRPRAGGAFQ